MPNLTFSYMIRDKIDQIQEAAEMAGENIYIVNGKRTPFGKFGGSLAALSPRELVSACSQDVLDEVKLKPESIDHVILGNVVPSSSDTLYGARHLALSLKCPESTPAYMVNRLCGSGLQSIADAFNLIKLGRAELVLSAGTENMSMVPHLTYGARFGTKYGPLKSVDLLLDALTDQYSGCAMGTTAENLAELHKISREECEIFSVNSHLKLSKAYKDNLIQSQITTVSLKRGEVSKDEHLREDIKIEDLQKLRSNFKKDGVVTPATASGIVDGASSVLVASESQIKANNLKPLARIVDYTVVGVDPKIMGIGPVPASQILMKSNNLTEKDIDLWEINEAFASQVLACQKELKIPDEKLNIWGGSIACGHPLGATGTRIALNLAMQLRSTGKKTGIATACIGGGQGIALLIETVQ